MQKEAFEFFEEILDTTRPLLVGLSGGPDSTCLLHLLLLWGKVKIHIVHVDHAWRAESAHECAILQQKAITLGLPFHHTRLSGKSSEAESRESRYQFFKKVAKEVDAQGIMLGHHADDLSETLFKRVLEGASLWSLAGMHKVRVVDGLTLFRPLLGHTKDEVLDWLGSKEYFIDPTNLESHNLRGKCRTAIFPYLSNHFGKEFESSLAKVAAESEELYNYLMRRCEPYLAQKVVGPWGVLLEKLPEERLEQKFILRLLSSKSLSRTQLDTICTLLKQNAANKQVANIFVDRGRLFFTQETLPDVEGSLEIREGTFTFGAWQVTVKKSDGILPAKNHFRDAWRGEIVTCIPEGRYLLTRGQKSHRRQGKSYGDFLTDRKIPHFLAAKVPVVVSENEIIEEFFSETKPPCKERNFLVQCSLINSWIAKNLD